jgi:hypothetical protein
LTKVSTPQQLIELGEHLINCQLHCEGIVNDAPNGFPPKGPIYDPCTGKRDCIGVGLNPGSSKKEVDLIAEFQANQPMSYEDGVRCLTDRWDRWEYYGKTREILSLLGFDRVILWTNLVKCECDSDNGYDFDKVPGQTKRVCIQRFLAKEITMLGITTIIALGEVSYNFCALSFPHHLVIGIPHPSMRNIRTKVIDKHITLIKKKLAQVLSNIRCIEDNNGYTRAIWLPALL